MRDLLEHPRLLHHLFHILVKLPCGSDKLILEVNDDNSIVVLALTVRLRDESDPHPL